MTVRILHGDCRDVLKTLPDNSVHCCVTSPPYWGLRSYLPDDHPDKHKEIGSEPTLEAWVQTMVEVFREVRRVLRPDGTLWLNLGDAYAGSRCGGAGWPGSTLNGAQPDHSRLAKHQAFTGSQKEASAAAKRAQRAMTPSARRDDHPVPRSDVAVPGLKAKDLMGQPWRVAFALQADGWWLRQEIIWNKPNPMPESTRDRCTKAHEHVFLLSKSERYFYNFEAMQEPVSQNTHARLAQNVEAQAGSMRAHAGEHRNGRPMKAMGRKSNGVGFGHGTDAVQRSRGRVKNNASFDEAMATMPETRNPRSVWTIPTAAFNGAHFATFPPELARRCITAGCHPGGMVLDPFGGSGTVGMVADRLHCHATLIDLDERNVPMATKRITGDAPLFAEVI